ncbi:glycosyltransferase [Pelagicoccus sp. SDUM812002]|uniref:glycosyltransferase n=1 Tax=Pelagicoccus sp. SDUM812002 TaxID=3041266 RepID=UPI0028100FDE|nr:glycosyltransferase [Pelagicoccus sp. SDUM812002]MDQ8186239.1 glycosyltransferase [Pelagicoccus sp. SDUM812002]
MDCFLVIPCLKESERVPVFLRSLCEAIEASPHEIAVQLVDDGSGPGEVERLRRVVSKIRNDYSFLTEVFSMKENRGKGAAIRNGWALAPDDVRILGFVDADGSVSAAETLRLFGETSKETEPFLVMASRRAKGARVDRSLLRKCVAAGFAKLVQRSYGVQVLDTQCGCKFLSATWYQTHDREFQEEGFGLDLELILKAQGTGCNLREVGIAWHEEPGSKVGFSDVWTLGKAIVRKRIGS